MSIYVQVKVDLGADWVISHSAFAADNITPLDLTGATLAMQIVDKNGNIVVPSASVLYTGIAPLSAGKSTLTISAATQQALGIDVGTYEYTIRATLSNGLVTDLNYGPWAVKKTAFG